MSYQSDAFFCGFDTLADAASHRAQYGGWIFHATEGVAIWFSPRFTPSSIISHHSTAGLSGKLV